MGLEDRLQVRQDKKKQRINDQSEGKRGKGIRKEGVRLGPVLKVGSAKNFRWSKRKGKKKEENKW